jgi:hypothetical protein
MVSTSSSGTSDEAVRLREAAVGEPGVVTRGRDHAAIMAEPTDTTVAAELDTVFDVVSLTKIVTVHPMWHGDGSAGCTPALQRAGSIIR